MFTSKSGVLSAFTNGAVKVTRSEQLLEAVQNPNIHVITIEGFLTDVPGFRLSPRQEIRGGSLEACGLKFRDGNDGVQLSSSNSIACLTLVTSPDRCSIWNDDSAPDFGTLYLNQLRKVVRVQVLAQNQVRAGHIVVRDLDIVAADSRAANDRPNGYGVFVLQGALTLWNCQPDPEVKITANVSGVSVGRPDSPVLGSGIFVAGHGNEGGSLHL
jgi:hypothetical protein